MDRILTGLELAVWGKKPIHHGDSDDKRWLDSGEIIEFTVNKTTANNVEFCINGNANHLIWFSQLNGFFLELDSLFICAATILSKNGEKTFINSYTPSSFIEYVKGKKFKVTVNSDGNVAKIDLKKYTFNSNEEFVNTIKKLVDEGKYTEAASYLNPGKEYDLTEV